ncbi:hypothetical protein ACEK07_22675 [Alcanivoracaceae bacterium MT1]
MRAVSHAGPGASVVASTIRGGVGAFNGEKEWPMTLFSEGLRHIAGGCAGVDSRGFLLSVLEEG